MKKTRLTAVFALLFAIIMAASCGVQNRPETGAASPGAAGPAGKVSVSVFDRGTTGQTQVDNNYWTDWIKEGVKRDLNIDVTFVPIPRSEEESKLNVLMAANEAPDICFTYNRDLIANYINQGGLTDLTELIKEHGKNLNVVLGEEVFQYGRFYGKLYSVPARRNFVSNTSYWIRKDWLDTLKLDIPDNTEDWYAAVSAFKTENPGDVEGVIPIALQPSGSMGNMIDTFTMMNVMSDEDIACMPEFIKPGVKDFYRYMNKLNDEDLLMPDFAIQVGDNKRDAEVMAGKVGFLPTPGVVDYPLRNQPGLVRNLWDTVPGSELVPCDPFTNPHDGGKHTKYLYALYGILAIVPSYSKNAKEAVQYLDWTTDYEVIKFLQFGEEGVQHNVVDGIPVLVALDNERKHNSPSNSDYTITQNGVNLYGNLDLNRKAWVMGYGAEYAELAEKTYMVGLKDSLLPFVFDRPVEAAAKHGQALNDKATTLRSLVVTCPPGDFDKLYDELTQDYMANGGQAVYDERVEVFKLMASGN